MPRTFKMDDIPFETKEAGLSAFSWQTSPHLGKIAGSKHLQFDIRSLEPGKFSFPYHFHRAAEELFQIISGEATLRTPEGFQKVGQGDLVFFEEGATGAHQLYNHGDTPCIYLDIRTTTGIDVCEYPDSGKIAILPSLEVFKSDAKVDYYLGEECVAEKWSAEMLKRKNCRAD
ncbi:cupin domain-containing protein [Geomesophilobacter sediminis]|uniref:Cupin domain-containing protein n=1 Tax=Geomesophilobacter sediminis TaxID=2798584 RepID=A0A8J7JM25_9BACT|nr:cupin domain-containing protein [Geomesophilobacter sediminis]MBJ6725595.1 cupin domain-containing protein [Geomesophilobacter sediminis]